jgi:hypothetical protein
MTRRGIPDPNNAQLVIRPDPQRLVIKPEPVPVSAGNGQTDNAAVDAWAESKLAFDPARGLVDHGVVVDEEFRKLILPSSGAERAGLERDLRAEGRALSPLIVWKGHRLLLDGHHRLEFCLKWQLPLAVVEIDLPDREAAKQWILAHQADKRNLSVLNQSWVRGMRYLLEKKCRGGTGANQHTREQMGQPGPSADSTAECLARQYQVSAATIKRDARLVEDLAQLAGYWGDAVQQAILLPDGRCTRGAVKWLVHLGRIDIP